MMLPVEITMMVLLFYQLLYHDIFFYFQSYQIMQRKMMCIGKNKVPLVVIFKIKFCPENFLLNYRIIFLIVSFVSFLQNSLFLECIFASFGLIMETSHVYCQILVHPPILICFDFFMNVLIYQATLKNPVSIYQAIFKNPVSIYQAILKNPM